MEHESSPFEDAEPLPVNSQTMRMMALSKLDDDYYLGGGIHEDRAESDDEMSSDDEVKSHLKELAGIEDKKTEKDAFGRKRRKSEFEDEMDDLLDRSISEYAVENMGALGLNPSLLEQQMAIEDDAETREQIRKIDEDARREFEETERNMASLELLPYDVDLTDSEIDPEMPAAVVKDKNGTPLKLIYSHKRGAEFNVEERRRIQKERRHRMAKNRPSEMERRKDMIKVVAQAFEMNKTVKDGPKEKPYINKDKKLKSILKKKVKEEEKVVEEQKNEEKLDEDMEMDKPEEIDDKDIEKEENPIKKAAMERQKEIAKNDELFYDDEEDDDNERWVQAKRRRSRGDEEKNPISTTGKTKEDVNLERKPKLDNDSDAVLSCPGCMTELSSDCQRHEIYKDQYRAMFVSNCKLDDQKVTVERTGKDKRKHKNKPQCPDSDIFVPVKCAVCGTSVAMMDVDEVYHFFNVLSGYA